MIIVQASMKLRAGKRDAAVAAFTAAMAGAATEKGCLEYRFTADLIDPALIHVIEFWEDEASLLAHFQGKPFKAFIAVAGDIVEPGSMSSLQGDLAPYAFPLG